MTHLYIMCVVQRKFYPKLGARINFLAADKYPLICVQITPTKSSKEADFQLFLSKQDSNS